MLKAFKLPLLLLLAAACSHCPRLFAQGPSQEAVDAKVKEIVDFIRTKQRADGSYKYGETHCPVGTSALVVLALRTAELPVSDPAVGRAVAYILTTASQATYEEALVICALEKVDPEGCLPRINLAAAFLKSAQRRSGGWGYSRSIPDGNYVDESCSQYAVLGLASAEACKAEFPVATKVAARQYFRNAQRSDGGWGYREANSTVSMTCAGLSSLRLLGEELETPVPGRCGEYKVDGAMSKGFLFLGSKAPRFLRTAHSEQWGYYAMYGLERTGILNGVKEIGGVDWYREGCANILAHGEWRSDVVSASFALLFITKNSAPYAITKWKWGTAWNVDRFDVPNWVGSVSKLIKQPLDWQTASLEKGLGEAGRASMIFAGGHGRFTASEGELAALRQFLDAGGVVVGEGCCGDKEFLDSFKKVMENWLFPGRDLKFQRLSASHPVMSCVNALDPEEAGVLMLGKGCGRKQVFLLTKDVSCSYNGDQADPYEVDRAKRVGANLLVYALGRRKPQAKFSDMKYPDLSLEEALSDKAAAGQGAVFKFQNPLGRVKHAGDWSSDPGLWKAMAKSFEKDPSLPAFDGEAHVDPESDDIFGCQALLIAGHGDPGLSRKAIVNLRRYAQNGGRIVAEACCSDPLFDKGFKKLAAAILPNRLLEPIPKDDPVWHFPCDISEKAPKTTKAMTAAWPELLGVREGSSWAVIYCPKDISCALEGDLEEDIPGLRSESAVELWANILSALMSPPANAAPGKTSTER